MKLVRLRFCALVAVAFCAGASLAKSGAEHLADINAMFGNEFKGNPYAEEVFKYISQGMDFGSVDGPVQLEKPGSSFLKSIRKEFPLFKGKHREFAHWGANGAIPKEVLSDFGGVYPGKEAEFVNRWHKYILTRREATRQMLGLNREGARVAQSVFSLVNTRHILGDWTTADPSGLRGIDGLVNDIEKSLRTILGRRSAFADKFSVECAGILNQKELSAAEKATQVAKKLDAIWPTVKPALTKYGFNGVAQKVKWSTLATEVEGLIAKNVSRVSTTAIGGAMKVGSRSFPKGSSLVAGEKAAARTLRGTSKAAQATKRFVKWIPYVGVAIDAGVNGYEAWGYQREYEQGNISRQERNRNWTGQAGKTIGGAAGAYAGGKIGSELFRNDNGEAGTASLIAGLVLAVVGGIAGSMAGESVATKGYDVVMTTPYEQACKLAQEGDRDAMRFAGEYLWNGKYTSVDKGKAFSWWLLKSEKDIADGKIDRTTLLRVGDCYATGVGTEKNINEAMYYYELSRTVGGALQCAKFRMEGVEVAQSYNQAINRLNSCADVGNEDARALLASTYEEAKDGWFVNDPECSYVLAMFYANGCKAVGVEQDIEKAVMLVEDAAENGYAAAINHMGLFYEYGAMGETNVVMAAKHYLLAAQSGNAFGLRNYGMCLLKGEGVAKDLKKGRECLLMAQKMGALDSRSCAAMLMEVGGKDLVALIEKDVEVAATDFMSDLINGNWFDIYCRLPYELKDNVKSFLTTLGQNVSDEDWGKIDKLIPILDRRLRAELLRELQNDSKMDEREKEMTRALVEKGFSVICAMKKDAVRSSDVKAILQAKPMKLMSKGLPKPIMGKIKVSEDLTRASIVGGDFGDDGDASDLVCVDGAWWPDFLITALKELPEVTKKIQGPMTGTMIVLVLEEMEKAADKSDCSKSMQ